MKGAAVMKKTYWVLALVFVVLFSVSAGAQEPTKPTLSVTAFAKVSAKPDIAIVSLTIRSSAPLAADALEQNTKKVQTVKERLTALGYKDDQVSFTGNQFAPAGGAMASIYPGAARATGFDVSVNLYVSIRGADLDDVAQFNRRVSTLLDELSKIGASPVETPISRIAMGGSSVVVFTVKDPAAYVKEATALAMEKARASANEIAQRLKVQITGIESVNTAPVARMSEAMLAQGEDLPYEYISSSISEVPIRVSLTVTYSFK
jgi:uncharacterized protein YggE